MVSPTFRVLRNLTPFVLIPRRLPLNNFENQISIFYFWIWGTWLYDAIWLQIYTAQHTRVTTTAASRVLNVMPTFDFLFECTFERIASALLKHLSLKHLIWLVLKAIITGWNMLVITGATGFLFCKTPGFSPQAWRTNLRIRINLLHRLAIANDRIPKFSSSDSISLMWRLSVKIFRACALRIWQARPPSPGGFRLPFTEITCFLPCLRINRTYRLLERRPLLLPTAVSTSPVDPPTTSHYNPSPSVYQRDQRFSYMYHVSSVMIHRRWNLRLNESCFIIRLCVCLVEVPNSH